jgi:hypothetical protein
MTEFVPKDSILMEERGDIAIFIPRVARKLSRADERVVERATAEANARYNARQKHVGTAALMSIPEISTESISTTP